MGNILSRPMKPKITPTNGTTFLGGLRVVTIDKRFNKDKKRVGWYFVYTPWSPRFY